MLCLGLPPLRVIPFFLYNFLGSYRDRNDGDTHPKGGDAHSEVPHGMNLLFMTEDADSANTAPAHSKAHTTLASLRDSAKMREGLAIAPNAFGIPDNSVVLLLEPQT